MLGPLEVEEGGKTIPLGGTKQRTLLALLLLARGRPVPTERLIDAIWTGRPPETAAKSIQVYVSGLRKALGEGRIVRRERGYELVVHAGEVDADRFAALVGSAAGAPTDEGAQLLREAIGLSRGPVLADLSLAPWAAPEATRLEEQVLAAVEMHAEAQLALGRHRELIAELEELVEKHPHREHILELLMIALYRSGRQADSLETYRRGATRLRDELGLEPGRSLKDLETAILRHDAALDAPTPAAPEPVSALRRRRGWKLVTGGAVVIVLAAVAAVAVAMARDGTASLESLPPGIALVDAESGTLKHHISTDQIPDAREVVSGSGDFWVWNLQPYSLVRIDPETGNVLDRIGSPFSGDAGWYLPDGDSVWFTGAQELVRVDAGEHRAVNRFQLSTTNPHLGLAWVAMCAGSLWVANYDDQVVLRVDASSGEVEARVRVQRPAAVACGDGDLWVSSNGVGLRRIDPRTNRIVATAPLPIHLYSVVVRNGYAWTTDETAGKLYKIDRSGRIAASYETGDGALQVAAGNGRIWVANGDAGTVTGIDEATGDRRTFRFGHPVATVGALGNTVLVALGPGRTFEDRIASLEGDVARLIVPTYVWDPPDPALASNPWQLAVERATCATLLAPTSGATRGGQALEPDLAAAQPHVSGDGLTYTFTVRTGRRFAPPSNAPVTAAAVRFSVERALSARLRSASPGIRFLGDVVGARAFNAGTAKRVRGIHVSGDTISFTLTRPSKDFLDRLSLPFFCVVPMDTPLVQGGVQPLAPPSAGPYYMSDRWNGEYMILKRNPSYSGRPPARLDAIAFREGFSTETAVGRVEEGLWDGALLDDPLLAPGGLVARRAAANPRLRYEVLTIQGLARSAASDPHLRFEGLPTESPKRSSLRTSLYALFSSRLGCGVAPGRIDLAALCIKRD